MIWLCSSGLQRLQLSCYQFRRLLESFLPDLHSHFVETKIVAEMFVVGWFQTLFVYLAVLPKATVDRIWDIFVFERDWKIIFRIALSLLQVAQPNVLGQTIDTTMTVLNTFPEPMRRSLEAEELIHDALSIKVTNSILLQLREELHSCQVEGSSAFKTYMLSEACASE